jgi:crossover junction endodeoxyribonuclease RuvC
VRVCGVDPGLTRCGVGIVNADGAQRLSLGSVHVIRTPSDAEVADRLLKLSDEFEALLDEFRPDRVVVERVFSQHNVRTVMGTAQAAAVTVLAARRRAIPVSWRTPTEVKAAVTGSGRADKAQVTAMVMRLLHITDPIRPADAADALALAICDVWRGAAEARLAHAVAGQR